MLHQLAVNRLTYRLDQRLPTEYSALQQVEMVVGVSPLTVRVPDVLVVPAALVETNPARSSVGDVRLVIEVLSEVTKRTDQVTKFSGAAELEFAGTALAIDLNALTTRRAQRL